MKLNFDTDFDPIAKEDPYFSEDDEINFNSFTDLANTLQYFNSLQPKVEEKTLEEQIHKQIKQRYYRNKYRLLALNELPNPNM